MASLNASPILKYGSFMFVILQEYFAPQPRQVPLKTLFPPQFAHRLPWPPLPSFAGKVIV
ncbi:hypothetical protein [Sphaerotilus microaerophilus]|uniref:hypothetical protein n=1 Tax=Sphaerotilus microaerophilus TaxID=2914710 RepID=UPI0020731447|nr:hypothetical protein [Sphaerotilus sp. FB-5]